MSVEAEYDAAASRLLAIVPLPAHLQKFDMTREPAWDFDGRQAEWVKMSVCGMTRLLPEQWDAMTLAKRLACVEAAIVAHGRERGEPTGDPIIVTIIEQANVQAPEELPPDLPPIAEREVKPATVEQRLAEAFLGDPSGTSALSAEKLRLKFGCSKTAIVNSETWKKIVQYRRMEGVERRHRDKQPDRQR